MPTPKKTKVLVLEVLRWSVIVVCGGYGAWFLFPLGYFSVMDLIDSGRNGSVMGIFFAIVFLGLVFFFTLPLLAIAFYVYRRQYRKLFNVLGIVGCFALWYILMSLPTASGFIQYIEQKEIADHSMVFWGLPFAVLWFFGPIYAGAWFFRLCNRFSYPPLAKLPPIDNESNGQGFSANTTVEGTKTF